MMPVTKARRGGAYVMVLTATMLLLVMVAFILSLTAISRRATARYAYNIGLFDLAVAGNEQALFLLRQSLNNEMESLRREALIQTLYAMPTGMYIADGAFRLAPAASGLFREIFIDLAMDGLGASNQFTWNLDVTIGTDDATFADSYRATTTTAATASHINRITATTAIHRLENNAPTLRTRVRAFIVLTAYGYRNFALDEHTIDMLLFYGAQFPIPPVPGMIIILDEFTLTMVESLRI